MGPADITTTRVRLRQWSAEDAPALAGLFDDPLVNRFINDGRPITIESAQHFCDRYARMRRERGWCRWALEVAAEPGLLAGFCGYGCTFAPEIELGWTLAPRWWGHGLATEAGRAALEYGFNTVGFARVVSAVDPDNHRSARVARRLGMQPDGTIEFEGHPLTRFAVENPGPLPPPDPRFVRDCTGEQAGRTLAAGD